MSNGENSLHNFQHRDYKASPIEQDYTSRHIPTSTPLTPVRATSNYDLSRSKPLDYLAPKDYVLPPEYSYERSQTMPNFLTRSQSELSLTSLRSMSRQSAHSPANNPLQRMNTALSDNMGRMTLTHNPTEDVNNPPGWNFRRLPSFHNNHQGSSDTPKTFDNALPQDVTESKAYMFAMSTSPDSNIMKSENSDPSGFDDRNKSRMPMYWLYGSRGRPNNTNDPINQGKDQINDNHTNKTKEDKENNLSDFLTGDRGDNYRCNYSNYDDQRKSDDKTISNGPMLSQAFIDGPKLKSILKKNAGKEKSLSLVTPGRYHYGGGGRLPQLGGSRRALTKRVSFAF